MSQPPERVETGLERKSLGKPSPERIERAEVSIEERREGSS